MTLTLGNLATAHVIKKGEEIGAEKEGTAHFDICHPDFCKLWTTVQIADAGFNCHRLSVRNGGEYTESFSFASIIWNLPQWG